MQKAPVGSDDLTITGNGIANTISDNTAGDGGAIRLPGGSVTVTGSTISGNTAGDDGGGVFSDFGTINSQNSIIQNNDDKSTPTADDCDGTGAYKFLGGNVVGVGTGCPATGPDDVATADAMLGPLQNNGGATETHALLAGSPAINITANGLRDCGTAITTDQIGKPRPFDGACDAGAFEFGVKSFVFLADELVKITQNKESDGDIHCNNDIEFGKGTPPGKHTGDLTAVDDVMIKSNNTMLKNREWMINLA